VCAFPALQVLSGLFKEHCSGYPQMPFEVESFSSVARPLMDVRNVNTKTSELHKLHWVFMFSGSCA